jgi:hypothetical protein
MCKTGVAAETHRCLAGFFTIRQMACAKKPATVASYCCVINTREAAMAAFRKPGTGKGPPGGVPSGG